VDALLGMVEDGPPVEGLLFLYRYADADAAGSLSATFALSLAPSYSASLFP
jgi:hypothetical protein